MQIANLPWQVDSDQANSVPGTGVKLCVHCYWRFCLDVGAVAAPKADMLDKIAADGVIYLGVRADAPPFSFLDAETEPAGLAVELCHEVAKRLGAELGVGELRIEHKIVNAKTRFPALAEGLTQLHCGATAATLTRRNQMDFSLLVFCRRRRDCRTHRDV